MPAQARRRPAHARRYRSAHSTTAARASSSSRRATVCADRYGFKTPTSIRSLVGNRPRVDTQTLPAVRAVTHQRRVSFKSNRISAARPGRRRERPVRHRLLSKHRHHTSTIRPSPQQRRRHAEVFVDTYKARSTAVTQATRTQRADPSKLVNVSIRGAPYRRKVRGV